MDLEGVVRATQGGDEILGMYFGKTFVWPDPWWDLWDEGTNVLWENVWRNQWSEG